MASLFLSFRASFKNNGYLLVLVSRSEQNHSADNREMGSKGSESDSFNNAHPECLPMGNLELHRQDRCTTRIKVLDLNTLQITGQLTTFQPQHDSLLIVSPIEVLR